MGQITRCATEWRVEYQQESGRKTRRLFQSLLKAEQFQGRLADYGITSRIEHRDVAKWRPGQ